MVSHMFADFGADVVKVEKPGIGDDLRNWKINGISHWWAVYSRNKRSISIDLKKDEGLVIPEEIDYDSFSGLSNEVKSKLKLIRPKTLGQALRIDGVTPAAAIILLGAIKRVKNRLSA